MSNDVVLGVSAYYHDSAAALLQGGRIVAAAQEERFSRKKHDARFPTHAVRYCLREAGLTLRDVGHVVFYDKPLVKFERLIETYLSYAPQGFPSFLAAIPVWARDKLFFRKALRTALTETCGLAADELPPMLFGDHHESHAASAFYASPFESAAVLCLDGVGEWATGSAWRGQGASLDPLWELRFPHSVGLLYSAFTYYTGFKVNSGEYKLMGLAPYGEPKYVDVILNELIDLKDDGTLRLNMRYFDFATKLRMTNERFDGLFGGPPRTAEGRLTQREMDIAQSIQVVTEEIVLRLCRTLHRETGSENLCLAGGVALNCVANGRVLREGPFKRIWIQPAAGDAGGALGAALAVWHRYLEQPRAPEPMDSMRGAYLGPRFESPAIAASLDAIGARYERVPEAEVPSRVAELLASENVVGWFQGRMEFGPRALGARSILGDARSPKMQQVMNLKIKYRESFRPFAPSVKSEATSQWFETDAASPYMLLVAHVREDRRIAMTEAEKQLFGIDKLNVPRSQIPAVTHVDYSARLQTVHRETNPRYWALLDEFEKRTGCAVIVNTSFNVRGEPIVCTPMDAYRCFMRTEMDILVLEDLVLRKADQPPFEETGDWRAEFELD